MPRCKVCSDKFTPKYSSLEKVCSKSECKIAYVEIAAKEAREKLIKKEKSEWNKRKSEMKKELYPKKDRSILQSEINKLARLIDNSFGYQCIDLCGMSYGQQIDACHFHSRGANTSIAYNLHNIHAGRSQCNNYSPTHISGYLDGLELRYGVDYAIYVKEELPKLGERLMLNEVQEKVKVVRNIIKNFDTYKFKNGLEARMQLNRLIGIYKDTFTYE